MVTIAVFVGTRPELIKLAPVIWKVIEHKQDLLFVHTGQHYDYSMSAQFVKELDLPSPNCFLDVGSSTHGVQTARVLQRAEKVLRKEKPDFVVILGDTNSVLGVALASAKLRIALGHVEAGCRSFDVSMPEELNRVIVADCATLHFAPTRKCAGNLVREGVRSSSIYLTGHPIVDLIDRLGSRMKSSRILDKLQLDRKRYVFLTVHREENADNPERLKGIMQALNEMEVKVVFPVHPRTKRNLKRFHIRRSSNVIATRPLGYFDSLNLIKNAQVVITDSGGVQQEACILGTPCVTVRATTEWTETVEAGVNLLSNAEHECVKRAYYRILGEYDSFVKKFEMTTGMFGAGDAADRILSIILSGSSIDLTQHSR